MTELVSIVTPSFNSARYLDTAIQSVLRQSYPHIEYLVVDSHSTDGTHEILARHGGRLRVITMPRLGAAAAIHAGFSEARGSILAWLSADDAYTTDAVGAAVTGLAERPAAGVIYGNGVWIDEGGRTIHPYPTISFHAGALAEQCFICQPTAFFRAAAYRECPLDTSLPVSFDYDFWIRLAARGCRFEYLPQLQASSRVHAECLTIKRRRQVLEVTMELLDRHYDYIPLSWVYCYLRYLRDGRDQFFAPLRSSPWTFAACLPYLVWRNRKRPLWAVREWTDAALAGMRRKSSQAASAARKPA